MKVQALSFSFEEITVLWKFKHQELGSWLPIPLSRIVRYYNYLFSKTTEVLLAFVGIVSLLVFQQFYSLASPGP
jgi:hypothetical protein